MPSPVCTMRSLSLQLSCLSVLLCSTSALSAPLTSNYQNGECYVPAEDGSTDEAPLDFFPSKVSVVYSKLWDISYFGTYKILTFKGATDSAGTVYAPETYLLYQCGTSLPSIADTSVKRDAFKAVLSVPVATVGVDATSEIPYLEVLGLRSSIAALYIDKAYVSSPCVGDMLDDGTVTYAPVGDETGWEVPVVDGVSMNLVNWGNPTGLVGPVKFLDYLEDTSVRAKAGWLKYMSVFFNAEEQANKAFDTMLERYACVGETARHHASKNEDVLLIPRKIVAWGTYSDWTDWDGAHHVGWSVAKCNGRKRDGSEGPYYCEFAKQTGVNLLNVTEDEQGSVHVGAYTYMTDDEFIAYAKNADILIYPSAYPSFTELLKEKPSLESIIAVNTKRVYDNQGNGLNDWFESTNAQPALMLEDFAYVADDETGVFYKEKLTWLRNVFKGEVGDAGICTDVNAPLEIPTKFECLEYDNVWSMDAPAPGRGVGKGATMIAGLAATALVILVAM